MRLTGVSSRGIISPMFKQGDDLVEGVCQAVLKAAQTEGYGVLDGDIVGVTESVVARTQGNYASCAQIAADVRQKMGGGTLGLVFPIMSRNRFSLLLKAISLGCDKLIVQLSYPADEVGNALLSIDQLDEAGVNPWTDSFTEAEFRKIFGNDTLHPFTQVDYIEFYKSLGSNIEVVFANNPAHILQYTDCVLCCDIHTRKRTKRLLKAAGAKKVLGLDDLLTTSVDGSGFNAEYGLLGSNMATPDSVKLFPRDCEAFVNQLQQRFKEETGKRVEVLVYGDGCFKDPVGGIWELADPVVSPAYTSGLVGTPNELKMKYFADNELGELSGEALEKAIRERIRDKSDDLAGCMGSEGTTPRRYSDLVGSLCDLTSGSGDRGTPVVHIQGYFTNYAT